MAGGLGGVPVDCLLYDWLWVCRLCVLFWGLLRLLRLCCVWCLVLGDALFLYVIGLLCLGVAWDSFWLFWFVGYSRVGCVVLLVLFVYVMGLYC